MASYGEYCPVAKGSELFAERWTPLIVLRLLWGVHRFNELERSLPGISRPLLSSRLRRLERAGIVERRFIESSQRSEYHLTSAGEELKEVVRSLGRWAARWVMRDPKPRELSPLLLLWAMRRRIDLTLVPRGRIVVRFDFYGAKRRTLWFVIEHRDVSICVDDPRYEPDLLVTADLATFFRVWQRRMTMEEALRNGTIEIDGPRALARAFPSWLQWSQFSEAYSGTVSDRWRT